MRPVTHTPGPARHVGDSPALPRLMDRTPDRVGPAGPKGACHE